MQKKLQHTFTLLLFCTFFSSCYSESGEEQICPSNGNINQITVSNIILHSEMPPLNILLNQMKQDEVKVPDIRFTICVFTQEGVLQERKVITSDHINQASYLANVSFYLPNGKYRFVYWADYVFNASIRDWFYDSQDLTDIFSTEPYTGNTDWKDAFTAYKDYDLSNANGKTITEEITLSRPFAKFRIIANDLAMYVQRGGNPNGITASISYQGETYNGYNAFERVAGNISQGKSFTGQVQILSGNELLVGWDFIWGEESPLLLKVNMVIHDAQENIINTVNGLKIPYQLGKVTTVTGTFLTSNSDSGIGIITEYEGEFTIPLP